MPMREEEILNIAIWTIRRLPSKYYKITALKELMKNYNLHESEYGEIESYINLVEKNGNF